MNQHEIAGKIGRGRELETKRGNAFRVTASDYGLEFDISTGNRRRVAWRHKHLGLVELYRRWCASGRPDSTVWVQRQEGVGTHDSSYVLATFKFLSRGTPRR